MILLPAYMLTHDLWALNHKVTFDGVNKLAIINHDVTTLDVAVELYSDWKEWVGSLETYRDFSKYEPAIRTIGGDPTVAGDAAGDIYFMTNGWRIYTDHSVVLTGDLFSDDFTTPFTTAPGIAVVSQKQSNLVNKIAPSQANLGNAIWGVQTASATVVDTMGALIQDIAVNASTAAVSAGMTAEQAEMLRLMYKMAGLDPTVPLIDQWNITTNVGYRKTANGSVVVQMVGDPEASVTTTRTT